MKYLFCSILTLIFISNSVFSQETEMENSKHLLGAEFRSGSQGDAGLVYRRLFPKVNIKVGAYFGIGEQQLVSSNNYLFTTNDPKKPFLLVNQNFAQESNNQLLEIGLEYKFMRKKYLTYVLGADLVMENRVLKRFGSVIQSDSTMVSRNGNNYYDFSSESGGALVPENIYTNSLESKYNYFGIGANLRYKLMYEISSYFIVSAEVGVSYRYGILYNSKYNYSSEEYREHLPEIAEKNSSNFNMLTSLGVHYIF